MATTEITKNPFVHTGPWDTYNQVFTMPGGEPVTIGIGLLCDRGETAILASDMRTTYRHGALPPSDAAGKQYDFAPFLLAASVAGEPTVCHAVISEISDYLIRAQLAMAKYPEHALVLDHVRRIIELSRKKELRKLQECAMQTRLGVGLADWQTGKLPNSDKLDLMALKWGLSVLQDVKEKLSSSLGLIFLGFVDNGPVFFRAQGAERLEEAANPEFYAIGSGSVAAMEVLISRQQNIFTTMARSLYNIYEALRAARQHERTVGPPAAYVVIRPRSAIQPVGMMRFPAQSRLLRDWYKVYHTRISTESLDKKLPNEQVKHLLRNLIPSRLEVSTRKPIDIGL